MAQGPVRRRGSPGRLKRRSLHSLGEPALKSLYSLFIEHFGYCAQVHLGHGDSCQRGAPGNLGILEGARDRASGAAGGRRCRGGAALPDLRAAKRGPCAFAKQGSDSRDTPDELLLAETRSG